MYIERWEDGEKIERQMGRWTDRQIERERKREREKERDWHLTLLKYQYLQKVETTKVNKHPLKVIQYNKFQENHTRKICEVPLYI